MLFGSGVTARAKELLTDVTVRNAKPSEKDQRLYDGGGHYLLLKANGTKWWRLDYAISGRRKTLSLGVYPKTTLSDARRKATEARNNVANGIDPSDKRKEKKQSQQLQHENQKRIEAGMPVVASFGEVALEYFEKKMNDKTERHQKNLAFS
ncbi:MAG: Arm DNA-binding domain-containing protein [Gammaproteobacteria bacterium]